MDTVVVYGTASNTQYSEYAFLSNYSSLGSMGGLYLGGIDVSGTDYQAAADAWVAENGDQYADVEEIVVEGQRWLIADNASFSWTNLVSAALAGAAGAAFGPAGFVAGTATYLTALFADASVLEPVTSPSYETLTPEQQAALQNYYTTNGNYSGWPISY